jgi:hypothetical protein
MKKNNNSKKRYIKPKVESETYTERRALACLKYDPAIDINCPAEPTYS